MANLFQHRIQPGDTLGDLAVWYNTTVEEIEDANPEIDPYNLKVGEVILIPKMLEQWPPPPWGPWGPWGPYGPRPWGPHGPGPRGPHGPGPGGPHGPPRR